MKLLRYIAVGIAQAALACGGIVFVEPFCNQCDYDAKPDTPAPQDAQAPQVSDATKPHIPDAQYAICPTLGGHCEWSSSTFLWCASDTTFWHCVSNVWYEEDCSWATSKVVPLCNTSGTACIGPRCF